MKEYKVVNLPYLEGKFLKRIWVTFSGETHVTYTRVSDDYVLPKTWLRRFLDKLLSSSTNKKSRHAEVT